MPCLSRHLTLLGIVSDITAILWPSQDFQRSPTLPLLLSPHSSQICCFLNITLQWFPSVLRMKSKLHILVRMPCLLWTLL